MSWAESPERAFAEFNRVALYLGVFVLAVALGTPANVRQWRDGIAAGIAAIGVVALASRLFPDFVDERSLFQFLPGGETRLSYPLDYWNGLGIFTGLAFPLLLGAATGARSALGRAVALAPLPALAATIYLTSSRGGAATAIAGVAVFLALTSRRGRALWLTLCGSVGSALAIAVLLDREELVDGPLQSAAATNQAESAAIMIALACIATAALPALLSRFAPRRSVTLGRPARLALAGFAVVAALVAIVAIDPMERVNTFKKPPDEFQAIETDFTRSHLLSGSGSGRWQFWETAADQFASEPLRGHGAGSYESYWAQHGDLFRFIRDAHSLYLETLGELGLIGFALLVGALLAGLGIGARRLFAAGDDERVLIASLMALVLAWCLAAGIDWMWELTATAVVAVAALGLLAGPAAAAVSRSRPREGAASSTGASGAFVRRRYLLARAGVVSVAMFVILTQAVPLLANTNIRDSQVAVARGDVERGLQEARDARDLQPWAASPHLQLALVQEQAGSLPAARGSILEALDNDSADWRLWLVRARVETKLGQGRQAARSLRRAERLNPRSPLFADE